MDLKPRNIRVGLENSAVLGAEGEVIQICVSGVPTQPIWVSVDVIDIGSSFKVDGKPQLHGPASTG